MKRPAATQYENLPTDVRKYIRSSYKNRLPISDKDLDKLMTISKKMEDRTSYIVVTKQSFVDAKLLEIHSPYLEETFYNDIIFQNTKHVHVG